MNVKRTSVAVLSAGLWTWAGAAYGAPVGTAFTYQGHLERPVGTPVTDTCSFQFNLWDAATGGATQGNSPQIIGGVQVNNGVFTVEIDFGKDAFNGVGRWLETSVQCTPDAGFELQAPRMKLTPAPYALGLPGVVAKVASDCCSVHGTAGCGDFSCQFNVCNADPFCCSSSWDSICVGEAQSMCGTLCEAMLVGVGTATPTAQLHVVGNIRGEGGDFMLNGRGGGYGNNGGAGRAMVDTGDGSEVTPGGLVINFGNDFGVVHIAGKVLFSDSMVGIGVDPTSHPLEMASGAHCTSGGVWTDASSRAFKENFAAADGREILEKVASLPIATWNYKTEEDSIRHVGPVAEDFHALFATGQDQKFLAALDTAGVALAAIQGLHQLLEEKDCLIRDLDAQNRNLEERLSVIERGLNTKEGGR